MDEILLEFERLTAQQTALEAEIAAIADELTSGTAAPGIHGALIDADGYPRGDIDVYRVRHQRHAFAVKQNDHKAVMKRIEQILPQVFDAKRAKAAAAAAGPISATDKPAPDAAPVKPTAAVAQEPARTALDTPARDDIDATDRTKKPFAVVQSVQTDSPAEWADVRAGDEVLVFGTADASNHRSLAAVKEIVQHNIGSAIRVVVQRRLASDSSETTVVALRLTPQQWRGPGVLGCLLVPVAETSSP